MKLFKTIRYYILKDNSVIYIFMVLSSLLFLNVNKYIQAERAKVILCFSYLRLLVFRNDSKGFQFLTCTKQQKEFRHSLLVNMCHANTPVLLSQSYYPLNLLNIRARIWWSYSLCQTTAVSSKVQIKTFLYGGQLSSVYCTLKVVYCLWSFSKVRHVYTLSENCRKAVRGVKREKSSHCQSFDQGCEHTPKGKTHYLHIKKRDRDKKRRRENSKTSSNTTAFLHVSAQGYDLQLRDAYVMLLILLNKDFIALKKEDKIL